MEPPAKRMRSLLSIEVDEENPEYINAKQKQQRKFKGRLESIFEKYGKMNDSMSDEIDMKTNTVVVDRGHLRRLERKVDRKEEMMLLDTLGLATGKEAGEEEGEEEEEEEEKAEDLEDELAPTQIPRSSDRRKKQDTHGQQMDSTVIGAQSSPSEHDRPALQQPHTPAGAIPQANIQHTSNTPNPAANLLQFVSFPQTPAGQQAQTAFYATLTNTINQAIQQAVVPLYNGLGLLPPNAQIPFANVQPAPTTPATTDDKIAPATDPKWFFPPLSAASHTHAVAQSSPLPTHPAPPRLGETTQATENATSQQAHAEPTAPITCPEALPDSDAPLMSTDVRPHEGSPSKPRRSSPRVEIQVRRPRSTQKKYHFTAQDDIDICTQKRIHKRPWAAIRANKEKWKDWPISAFNNRWHQGLKNKELHIKESSIVRSGDGMQASDHDLKEQVPASPIRSHHLPTPSSLEYEDSHNRGDESLREGGINNLLSSSAHFDDDERELLSLAGADPDDDDQLPLSIEEDVFSSAPEDVILPSIETADYMSETNIQESLLEQDLPMRNATLTPVRPSSPAIKPEPTFSSPTSNRKRHTLPLSFHVDAESEDETPAHQEQQQQQQPPRTSVDLVGNDDDLVQTPTTPHIKRETSTPPPSFFSAVRTPNTRVDHDLNPSSGAKSTSKVDRKTFLKQVKKSWAKGGTPAVKGRKSFHVLPRKRAWVDEGDGEGSQDELAM